MIDTKELLELMERATPGPWHTSTECPARCCWHLWAGLPMYGADDDQPLVMGEVSEEDAAFMVAARNALPELLDEVARLQKACRLAVLALAHATQEHGEAYRSAYELVSTALQESTS